MFTPNVQRIVDDLRQEFPTVRVGAWNCRRIVGTLTWSQHAYTEENHLDPDFQGNAADIFPFNMATGDRVAAYLRSEYSDIIKVVLWRVKNHFDHVHFDTWPTGINLPPCKGGKLQVRHKDGKIGRTFDVGDDDLPLNDQDKAWIRSAISSEVREALVENKKISETHDAVTGPLLGDVNNPTPEQAWNRTTDNVEQIEAMTARLVKKLLP